MRVFVTGATGFIGSAVVKELIAAGHQVIGLCRSDDKAPALAATGAEVYRGSITEPDGLRDAVARADGVIHLAFNHDFSRFEQNCADDRTVIRALGGMLGSGRPLIVTSGTAMADGSGQLATEDGPTAAWNPRSLSEQTALALGSDGVKVSIVRLAQIHDTTRAGLVTYAVQVYRDKGVSAYIGDGGNRWPAAPLGDVARLYRLALERAEAGAIYHAVAEEGITLRAMAETLARRLDLPVKSITPDEAQDFFGWLAIFAGHDMPASSAQTRAKLGWQPTGRGLLADLAEWQLD